jgi:hypothetical protein
MYSWTRIPSRNPLQERALKSYSILGKMECQVAHLYFHVISLKRLKGLYNIFVKKRHLLDISRLQTSKYMSILTLWQRYVVITLAIISLRLLLLLLVVPIYVMRDLLFLFCIFVCVYVCICLFVCVYIYIYMCLYMCGNKIGS